MNTPSSPVSLGYYTHHAEAYAQAIAGAEAFYAEHGGATAKHMAALMPWLERR